MAKKDAQEKVQEQEIKVPETEIKPEDQPPEGYTAEEWADLSQTEREGIMSPEEEDEGDGEEDPELDEETLKAIAGEEGGEVGETDQTLAQEGGEEEGATEGAAPGPAAEGRILDADLLGFRPVIDDSKIVVEEKIPVDIQTKLEELDSKFDESEIDIREYNRQRDALNRQIIMASMREREEKKVGLVWDQEQNYFLGARPEYLGTVQEDGKFKSTMESAILFGALGKAIESLNADPSSAGLTGMQLLVKADSLVKKMFGRAKDTPTLKAGEEDEKTKDHPKGGGPIKNKPKAPLPNNKTLSGIPQAASNSTDDVYAQLDKLTGDAYERALEKLTPEQKEAYERRL